MKKAVLFSLALALAALVHIDPAAARGYVGFGFGCCGGYYPYYAPYPYPAYYVNPPPTVIYAQPAPSATYIVQQPAAAPTIIQTPPQPATATRSAPSAPDANNGSPQQAMPQSGAANGAATFVDDKGRTCRKFHTVVDGDPLDGIACLQQDGSWRTVSDGE